MNVRGRLRVPGTLLDRPRLLRVLDAAIRRPVTLVCAGAGWGKSALVASWSIQGRAPVGWLTLGPEHDDPETFCTDLLETLDARPATGFEGVGRGIADLREQSVLVLDDVHVLHRGPVLDGLGRLLLDLPDRLRVVLIGRSEPPVALHRLRAAGDLVEIRRPQLAFRTVEAGELLMLRGLPLSPARTRRLVERSEGWPVGILLSAARPEAVGDYLLREVVDALPPDSREFMLNTSITRTISGELAEALTGESHGARILEGLERSNAFVSRADGPWFRYDGLLRDVLRHEAGVRSPDAVADLHGRAARWYAARGNVHEALDHAVAAKDWAALGRLVVEYAVPMALSSNRDVLAAALRAIPPEQLADTPDLALCGALRLLVEGDYAGVRDQLDGEDLATDVVRLVVAPRLDGDMPKLVEDATRLLSRLGTIGLERLPCLMQYRAIALNFKGIGLLWQDRSDTADRYLWAASTAARSAGVQLVEISAYAHLAVLVYLQGSLREAEHYIGVVDELTRKHDLDVPAESTAAHLTRALIALDRNETAEAQKALRHGLHAAGEMPETVLAMLATMVRAQTLMATGEPAAARDLLARCRARMRPPLDARLLDRWLSLAEAEADLALGDHADVVLRYASRDVLLPPEQVMLARAYEAAGEYAEAENLASRVREGPDAVCAATAWVVTALIADARGHARLSADALARAVRRAEAEGIRQPFGKFDDKRMATLSERERWLHSDIVPVSPVATLDDPLSVRERDVLGYLPTVLTANEIAADLNISVNTVKAHMRSIYRKLGAVRRREAVVRARQTGLL